MKISFGYPRREEERHESNQIVPAGATITSYTFNKEIPP